MGEKSEKAKKKTKSSSSSTTSEDAATNEENTNTDESTNSSKSSEKSTEEKSKSSKDKKKKKKLKKKKSEESICSVGSGSSYYHYDSDSSLSSSGSEISLLSEEVKKKKFRRVMAKEASKSSLLDSASIRGSINNRRQTSLFSDDEDDSADLEQDELTEFQMDLTFLKSSFQQSSHHNTNGSIVSNNSGRPPAETTNNNSSIATTGSLKKSKHVKTGVVVSDDPDTLKPRDSIKNNTSAHNKEKKEKRKKETADQPPESACVESSKHTDEVFDWASIAGETDKKKNSRKSTGKKDKPLEDLAITQPTLLRRTKSSGDSVEGDPLIFTKRKKLTSIKKVKPEEEVITPKRKSRKLKDVLIPVEPLVEDEVGKKKGKKVKDSQLLAQQQEQQVSGEGKETKKKKTPKEKQTNNLSEEPMVGEERNSSGSKDLKDELIKHDWQALSQEDQKKKEKAKRKNSEKEGIKGNNMEVEIFDATGGLNGDLIYKWSPKKPLKSPKKSKLKKAYITERVLAFGAAADFLASESKGKAIRKSMSSVNGESPPTRTSPFGEDPSMDQYHSDGENTAIHALTKLTRTTSLQVDNKVAMGKIRIIGIPEKTSENEVTASTARKSLVLPSSQAPSTGYHSDGENTAIHALKKLTRTSLSQVEDKKLDTEVKGANKKKRTSDHDVTQSTVRSTIEIVSAHSLDGGETKSASGHGIEGIDCSSEEQSPQSSTGNRLHDKRKVSGQRNSEAIDDNDRIMSAEIAPSDPELISNLSEATAQADEQLGDVMPGDCSAEPTTDTDTDQNMIDEELESESNASCFTGSTPMPSDAVLVSDVSTESDCPKRRSKECTINDSEDQTTASTSKASGVVKSPPKERKKKGTGKLDFELEHSSIRAKAQEEEEDALIAYVNSILKTFTEDPKQYSDEAMLALLKEFPQTACMKFHLEASTFRGGKGKTRHYLLSLLCALGASRETTALCFSLHPDAIHKFDEHVGTPLHYAISFGISASFSREMWTDSIFDTVEFLLEQEPRLLSSQHNHMRQTVLHQAIVSLFPPSEGEPHGIKSVDDQQNLAAISDVVISLLLETNNSIATLPDVKNLLPLHLAALCAVPSEILQRLLGEYSAACNVKCLAKGFTPLHYAVQVFAAAASAAPVWGSGATPVSHPSFGDHVANIKALINEEPSAAQIQDINGDLPLHVLVSGFYGHYSFESQGDHWDGPDSAFVKVMQLLCTTFPEAAHIPGSHGKTPLMIVQKHGGSDAVVRAMIDATLPESVESEYPPE